MADTLEKHKYGLLSYYRYLISTGLLEGTNNEINALENRHMVIVIRNSLNSKSWRFT